MRPQIQPGVSKAHGWGVNDIIFHLINYFIMVLGEAKLQSDLFLRMHGRFIGDDNTMVKECMLELIN